MNAFLTTALFYDQGGHGWQGPQRQGFGPCLDFGFQYALIKDKRSKKIGVEY